MMVVTTVPRVVMQRFVHSLSSPQSLEQAHISEGLLRYTNTQTLWQVSLAACAAPRQVKIQKELTCLRLWSVCVAHGPLIGMFCHHERASSEITSRWKRGRALSGRGSMQGAGQRLFNMLFVHPKCGGKCCVLFQAQFV